MKTWSAICKLGLAAALTAGSVAMAAPKSLERELKDLDVKDAIPSSKLVERIYAVQGRATPLAMRPELTVAMAQNFSGSGFLETSQWTVEGIFHFSDRWAMAAAYSQVSNKFTKAANNLLNTSGYLPDVDYAKSRMEARALYNVFYGKFRFSRSQSMSFDNYLGLGAVQNDLRSGQALGAVAEVGFAFFFPKDISVRVGVKDYFYKENRTLSQGYAHNVHGYLQTGYLF